jgi:hypothetical protein
MHFALLVTFIHILRAFTLASRCNLNFGIDVRNVASVIDYLLHVLVRVADFSLVLLYCRQIRIAVRFLIVKISEIWP